MSLEDALRFDQAAYALAQERVKSAPITLTEHDFDQLAIVSPRFEDDAREALRLAQLAIVQSHAAPLTTKSAAAVTKSAAPTAYVTRRALTKHFESYTKATATVFKELFQKNRTRIEALEQRVKELESRPLPKYCGVHRDGDAHTVGDLVTRSGGLWLAAEATSSTPGTASGHWRLIVKRGEA